MRVPSPDETIVALSQRVMAIPQAMGVPLPLALVPLPVVRAVVCAVAIFALTMLGAYLLALALVPSALIVLNTTVRQVSGYRRDARDWDEAAMARYAATASHHRENGLLARALMVALNVLAWTVVGLAAHRMFGPGFVLANLPGLIFLLATLANLYARCAMPCGTGAEGRNDRLP